MQLVSYLQDTTAVTTVVTAAIGLAIVAATASLKQINIRISVMHEWCSSKMVENSADEFLCQTAVAAAATIASERSQREQHRRTMLLTARYNYATTCAVSNLLPEDIF